MERVEGKRDDPGQRLQGGTETFLAIRTRRARKSRFGGRSTPYSPEFTNETDPVPKDGRRAAPHFNRVEVPSRGTGARYAEQVPLEGSRVERQAGRGENRVVGAQGKGAPAPGAGRMEIAPLFLAEKERREGRQGAVRTRLPLEETRSALFANASVRGAGALPRLLDLDVRHRVQRISFKAVSIFLDEEEEGGDAISAVRVDTRRDEAGGRIGIGDQGKRERGVGEGFRILRREGKPEMERSRIPLQEGKQRESADSIAHRRMSGPVRFIEVLYHFCRRSCQDGPNI